jgi:RNA polymerase sigma-70 factor (ECF subfamily)
LLGAYRAGRDEAFEALMQRYQRELLAFLTRFLGKRAAGEDVFQETFLQVHLSAASFDTSRRFKPWLFTIAANKARDYLRRNKRHKAAPLSAELGKAGDGGGSYIDLLEADLPLPAIVAEDAETAQRVRAVIDQMPDHLREVLLLAYFQQFPYKQIAEMLHVPLGTVKSRLHAAVGTFGKLWKQDQENLPEDHNT